MIYFGHRFRCFVLRGCLWIEDSEGQPLTCNKQSKCIHLLFVHGILLISVSLFNL